MIPIRCKAGDTVEVRSAEEILNTLDEQGALDGMPFMPEMFEYCGKRFPTTELSLDHVIPRSQGGATTWDNIVCACVDCNVRKGGRTPRQANMTLIRKPEKPKRSPLLNLKLSQKKYQSWQSFIDNAYWNVELK